MKTLLLRLPENLRTGSHGDECLPPYGLAMLSTVLKQNKKQAALLDAQALNWSWSRVQDYISDYRPDLIGFSVMTCELPRILSVMPWIKEGLPNTKIVLGGPHVTGEPAGTLTDCPDVDFVVLGEGEETVLELVRALENGSPLSGVKGIACREQGEVRVNPRRDPIRDLDGLLTPTGRPFRWIVTGPTA